MRFSGELWPVASSVLFETRVASAYGLPNIWATGAGAGMATGAGTAAARPEGHFPCAWENWHWSPNLQSLFDPPCLMLRQGTEDLSAAAAFALALPFALAFAFGAGAVGAASLSQGIANPSRLYSAMHLSRKIVSGFVSGEWSYPFGQTLPGQKPRLCAKHLPCGFPVAHRVLPCPAAGAAGGGGVCSRLGALFFGAAVF